jgi:hypothetical protein
VDDQRHPYPLAVDQLRDLAQPLKVNFGVFGLVNAVRRADGGREEVNAGPFDKLDRLIRVGERPRLPRPD